MRAHLLLSIALLGATSGPADACTAFCISEAGLVAKNYDWSVEDGYVMVNKRSVRKSFDLSGAPDSPGWVSRFGSVTFNQYGRDLPQGGVNEEGLVVEILWLDDTTYPEPDERSETGATQWIQYQLDTSGSVDDVVASLEHVRVRSSAAVHYFVADRDGQSAAVEYLAGRAVVHSGKDMPAPVLTNHTYEQSRGYLDRHAGAARLPSTRSSLDRFVRAASGVRNFDSGGADADRDYAFDLLASVAQGEGTKWSITYDLREMRVHFRTWKNERVRSVDFDDVDFSCDTPVRVVDLNADLSGDLKWHWSDWSVELNRELIQRSYEKTAFLQSIPASAVDVAARYPETARCSN